MRQINALRDRWYEEWQMRDRLNAQVARSLAGGKLADFILFPNNDDPDGVDGGCAPAEVGERVERAMRALAETNK